MDDYTPQPLPRVFMQFEIPTICAPELQLMAVIEEATKKLMPGTTPEDVCTRARVAHWYHSRHTEYSPATR